MTAHIHSWNWVVVGWTIWAECSKDFCGATVSLVDIAEMAKDIPYCGPICPYCRESLHYKPTKTCGGLTQRTPGFEQAVANDDDPGDAPSG
jgi:hypothetical protein